jgi:hypothetical protein
MYNKLECLQCNLQTTAPSKLELSPYRSDTHLLVLATSCNAFRADVTEDKTIGAIFNEWNSTLLKM